MLKCVSSLLMVFIIGLFTFGMMTSSQAATYNFEPTPNDLYDLSHGNYYTWGIDWVIPDGEEIYKASITFDNIENWNSGDNRLYLQLLPSAVPGVTVGYDPGNVFHNEFEGQGIHLHEYVNLSNTPQDLVYGFNSFYDLPALTGYLVDGNFGLGFDPDCHFYNDGIQLKIFTESSNVPIPATAWLFISGLGFIGIKSKMRK